jgi:hypothetical protein
MASNLNAKAAGAKVPPKSKVNSPSNTPEEALANAGGMPPEKTETGKNGINESTNPKRAPGAVHGV